MLVHIFFHVVSFHFSLELKKKQDIYVKAEFFSGKKKKTNYILVKVGKAIDTEAVTHFNLSLSSIYFDRFPLDKNIIWIFQIKVIDIELLRLFS